MADTLDKQTENLDPGDNGSPFEGGPGIYDDSFQKTPVDDQAVSPDELEEAENNPDNKPSAPSENNPNLYRPWREGMQKDEGSKRSKWSRRKKWLIAGSGTGGMLIILGILFFFLASLKLPTLAENIGAYRFARLARTFNQSVDEANAEKFAIETADDSAFAALKEKYTNLRNATWGKLDQYRPKKVFENLEATGRIDYKYGEPRGIFGRQPIEAVVIDGNEIPVADQRLFHPIANYKERIRFAADVDVNVDAAFHGYKSLIRGSVAKRIREEFGVKLKWWQKLGKDYQSLSDEEADRLALREAYGNIYYDPHAPPVSNELAQAANEAEAELENCFKDDACTDQVAKTGDLPPSITSKISTLIQDNGLEKAVGTFSSAYAIAVPVCLIYEGSIENSGPIIDAQNAELQRTYYGVATAADQQKAGDTTSEAVAAMNRKLGNISDSNPEMLASGQQIATSSDQSPEASGGGEFTILDVLLPSSVAGFLNTVAKPVCPKVTNVWTGLALGATELVIGFFTGGTSSVAEEGVKTAVVQYLKSFSSEFFTKKTLSRFLIEAAGIGATTFLARLLVLSRMGAHYNGIANGTRFDNQADMGGVLASNELDRQQFYGRPMTNQEVAESHLADLAYLKSSQENKSAYERYFALGNVNSLVSRLALSLNYKGFFKSIFSGLATILNPTSYGKLFGIMLSHNKVLAATNNVNYGVTQWGWSQEETNLIDNNPDYYPLRNSEVLDKSGSKDEIANKYHDCFSQTLGQLFSEKKVVRNKDGSVADDPAYLCSPVNLGLNNSSYGDLVFRYRLAMRNDNTLNHLLDIQSASGANQ